MPVTSTVSSPFVRAPATAARARTGFAATVRDLRTVMVLRRQLVQEQHRTRPWFRLPPFPRQTIWRRDLHGILRFPVVRLLRMAALTAVSLEANGGLCRDLLKTRYGEAA